MVAIISLPVLTVFTLAAPSALLSAVLSAVFLPPQAMSVIPIIAIAAATANFFIFISIPPRWNRCFLSLIILHRRKNASGFCNNSQIIFIYMHSFPKKEAADTCFPVGLPRFFILLAELPAHDLAVRPCRRPRHRPHRISPRHPAQRPCRGDRSRSGCNSAAW